MSGLNTKKCSYLIVVGGIFLGSFVQNLVNRLVLLLVVGRRTSVLRRAGSLMRVWVFGQTRLSRCIFVNILDSKDILEAK